jgi:hypothetical protein
MPPSMNIETIEAVGQDGLADHEMHRSGVRAALVSYFCCRQAHGRYHFVNARISSTTYPVGSGSACTNNMLDSVKRNRVRKSSKRLLLRRSDSRRRASASRTVSCALRRAKVQSARDLVAR